MTNKKILEKASEKAIKNGWSPHSYKDPNFTLTDWTFEIRDLYSHSPKIIFRGIDRNQYAKHSYEYGLKDLLFNHNFAKAFWGNEMVSEYGKTYREYKQDVKYGMHYPYNYEWHSEDFAWGWHLKQMVLEGNPLDYIKMFLKADKQEYT